MISFRRVYCARGISNRHCKEKGERGPGNGIEPHIRLIRSGDLGFQPLMFSVPDA